MDYKVSVIVPIFNVEPYLSDCINSLLNQTLNSLQIILIDDGSKDKSGEIADEFSRKFKNIECYHKENGGSASARNEGLKHVKGEYIAFLDADDWVEPQAYDELYSKAKMNGDVDVVFYKAFGNQMFYTPREGLYNKEQIKKELFPYMLPSIGLDGKPVYTRWSSCMRFYRAAFLFENNLTFNTKAESIEDMLFTFETTLLSDSYYYYNKPLYRVVENPKSKSRNYRKNMYKNIIEILNCVKSKMIASKEFDSLASYYNAALYLIIESITNEMRIGNSLSKIKRINRIQKSDLFYELIEKKDEISVCGWYKDTLDMICAHNAVYIVYKCQWKPKVKKAIRRIRNINDSGKCNK